MTPDSARGAAAREKEAADQFEFADIGWLQATSYCAGRPYSCRPQFLCGSIQHRIHELMAVGRAELLGELHRFGERHTVGQFRAVLQLVQPQP